jgi:diadenosine tetraphosphate (Ap4A) HIT family hydrolase
MYSVWNDRFPVTPGHLLWIPKQNNIEHIKITYGAAFDHGQQQIKESKWAGFNIGQNIGLAAGQTVLWPHIHLIPRHKGDCEPGRNGIRLSFPNGDHKEYY